MLDEIKKEKYLVDINSTIEDAWSKIELNLHRSVIVTEGNKVVGTISDGDLRKAMLSRRLLITPVKEVMNTNFIAITESKRAEAGIISLKKNIFLIPIVDDNMNLIDIYIR